MRVRPGRVRVVALAVAATCLVAAVLAVSSTIGERDRRSPEAAEQARAGLEQFLEPWYDAVRGQQDAPAKVVVVGDSISEGAMMPSPVHENRFVGLLQEMLRDSQDTSGGAGFLPAFYADGLTPDDTVRTGAPPQEYKFERWGLGGRALLMPHTSTLTYPALPATRVRVWFGRTDFVGGQGKVYVDGEDLTDAGTLSTGEPAGGTLSSAGDEPRSGLWWESPELDPDSPHVVAVTSVVPRTVFLHTGVEFLHGDEDSGIHVYDASHSGAVAGHFVTPEMQQGHWADVAAIEPQLVLVNLGTNADTDYATNLELVVRHALDAAPGALVLLVDGYEPGHWTAEAWQEVRRARAEVAARHPDRVAVFDLAASWPALAKDGSGNAGLMLEETTPIHPNREGNERMAEIFADLLAPGQ